MTTLPYGTQRPVGLGVLNGRTERTEEQRETTIRNVKKAAELNAEIQAKYVVGSPEWHKHETIDDRLFDALTALALIQNAAARLMGCLGFATT